MCATLGGQYDLILPLMEQLWHHHKTGLPRLLIPEADRAHTDTIQRHLDAMWPLRHPLQGHVQHRTAGWGGVQMLHQEGLHNGLLADYRAKEVLLLAITQGAKIDRAFSALHGVGEATRGGRVALHWHRRGHRSKDLTRV